MVVVIVSVVLVVYAAVDILLLLVIIIVLLCKSLQEVKTVTGHYGRQYPLQVVQFCTGKPIDDVEVLGTGTFYTVDVSFYVHTR